MAEFTQKHAEILVRLDERTEKMCGTQEDHEKRIRGVESKLHWYAGVGAAALFVWEALKTKLLGGAR